MLGDALGNRLHNAQLRFGYRESKCHSNGDISSIRLIFESCIDLLSVNLTARTTYEYIDRYTCNRQVPDWVMLCAILTENFREFHFSRYRRIQGLQIQIGLVLLLLLKTTHQLC
jgi:hypothetical protein